MGADLWGGNCRRLRAISILLAGRGWRWMGLAMVATLVQALAENLMVAALVLLGHALGILDASRFPAWMPPRLAGWGVPMALGALAVLGLVRAGCQAGAACVKHAMLERVRARIQRVQVYRMLMLPRLPPVSLSEASLMMGDHLNKATSWCFHGAQLITSGLMVSSFLLGLFWLAWKEALLATACLVLLGLLVRKLNRVILGLAAHIPRHRIVLERALVRISRNRLLIRVMRLQDVERRRYDATVWDYFRSSCRTFFLRDIAVTLPPLLGIFVVVLMVGINVAFLHTPGVTLMSSIYLFVALTRQTAVMVDQVGGMMHMQLPFDRLADLVFSLEGAHRTRALKGTSTALPDSAAPARGGAAPPAITLRGVDFRWPGARSALFRGLDLNIPAGSRFGIMGPNGSGKTTLLHLILGLEEAQAGEILVGGLSAADFATVGGPVSYVGTDNLLILGTVRDNLLYGVSGRPGDEVLRRALDEVGLGPWVKGLTDGLDHSIGENEEGLSSGQKQRLSLARALLRRPSLLVLDEASANIDHRSELELTSLLDNIAPTCTILIVSHKPGILTGTTHRIELPGPPSD